MAMNKIKSACVETSTSNSYKQPQVKYESKKTGDFNHLSNNHFESAQQNPTKAKFRKHSNLFVEDRYLL